MGFRITTNMMMNSYRFNLQNSTKKLSDARDKVLTHRNFNSYAEDPAAAAQAFRLRRTYYQTSSQLSNTKEVYSKFNTAWHNLGGVVEDLSDATARVASIRGNNGTAGESRKALAVVLRETAESVVHAMNQQLGDHFIFAGNDALNVPFSWQGDDLYYRGVNVNAGSVEKPAAPETDWMDQLEKLKADEEAAGTWDTNTVGQAWYDYYTGASTVKPEGDGPGWLQAWANADVAAGKLTQEEADGWIAYYQDQTGEVPAASEPDWAKNKDYFDSYGTPNVEKLEADGIDVSNSPDSDWIAYYKDQSDLAKLDAMSKEEMYIDLGMGAAESAPNMPVKGSYFNSALSGVDFIGYGFDEDGDSQNLAIIMKDLADVFETWGENGQRYLPEKYRDMSYDDIQAILKAGGPEAAEINAYHAEKEDAAFRLMDKLKAAQEHTTEKWVELDAQSVFLKTNEEQLTTQQTDVNMQILDIEQIDLADAITAFSWDQYCYNAALKIGNQLLSQSLIDYMG